MATTTITVAAAVANNIVMKAFVSHQTSAGLAL
jgi:hypothetical protein